MCFNVIMNTTTREGFNDVINGHFVPRVYLKSFTNGKDDKVMCLFKDNSTIGMTSTNKICVKRYMYTQIDETGHKDNSVEHAFSDFESNELHDTIDSIKGLPYNVIHGGYYEYLPNELKTKIIRTTLVQAIRGLKLKEQLLPIVNNIYHETYDEDDAQMQRYLPELYQEIKQKEPSIIQNTPSNIVGQFLDENNGPLVQFLNGMTCHVLYIEDDDIEFVTSDEPVLIYNDLSKDIGLMKVPLIDKDTIVCYPVTPKIAVMFSWGKVFGEAYDGDGIVKIHDCVDFIQQLNMGQYRQSGHCVIAKSRMSLDYLVSRLS